MRTGLLVIRNENFTQQLETRWHKKKYRIFSNNGTSPNFKNMRTQRHGNFDKRKKSSKLSIKWQKWIFYGFRIFLKCTYEGHTYCYMFITNISILQAVSFQIYIIWSYLRIVISIRSFCYVKKLFVEH